MLPIRPSLLGLAGSCLIAAGCQSLVLETATRDPGLEKALTAQPPEHLGTLSVEYYPVGGTAERAHYELKQVTYIQSALEQTGALDRFRREKIYLYRKPSGQSLYTKLSVPMEAGKGRVPPSSDYALRDGDRLVIVEDPSDVFDDLIGNLNSGFVGDLFGR